MTCPNLLTAIVDALRSAGATKEIIAVAVQAAGAFEIAPPRDFASIPWTEWRLVRVYEYVARVHEYTALPLKFRLPVLWYTRMSSVKKLI
jgi:hypothetical protein